MIVLEKMLMLFSLMLIGYIACKKGMITPEVEKKISGLIVKIANPALILSAVVGNDAAGIGGNELLQTLTLSIILYGALIAAGEVVPRILKVDRADYGMYKIMTVFSNMGYMGFPIIMSIYGKTALIYASVFLIPFNILIYTYGIYSIKAGKEEKGFRLKELLNNGVIACLIMVVLIVVKIEIPLLISDTIESISSITVPMSMMLIGASLVRVKLKELFRDVRLLAFSGIKLIVIPVIGILILSRFVQNDILLGVSAVVLAAPVGSLTAMLAQEYGGDFLTASKGITITTLFSVITIPLVFVFIR